MDDLAAYEVRFRRAGLPLLIEDYSAREDVFTRAFGLFAFVGIAEVLGALNLEWSFAANVAAISGALAFLLGGFALVNRLRGRPALARPQSVDPPELVGFVLVPALLPVVFNGQVTSAIVTAAGNTLLVGLVWLVVGFGLVSIVRWAAVRFVAQLSVAVTLLARAIPLLMLFAVVLFVNTEFWQVFSAMPDATLAATAGLLALIGIAFLGARLPREVAQLEHDVGSDPPLRRLQRVNVALVLFVSQGLQVLVVSAAVGAFFVAFGLLAIDASIQESWLGSAGDAHVTFDALGREMRLTPELLRVAIGIASLAGLYYAIAVFVDPTYREEFLDELTGDLRATFEDRAAYLAVRAAA